MTRPVQNREPTRLWNPVTLNRKSDVVPKGNAAECPICGTPFETRPFCGRDGYVRHAFAVTERYQVEDCLGAGGAALVFGARHLVLGKQIALKIPRRELAADRVHADRFLREAQIASKLDHENIVRVIDCGHDAELGTPFLVMERLRGRTLDAVIAKEGPLPWMRAASILVQLGRALGFAHSEGVVHRDLSPRNIVLTDSSGRSDVVKLCDFGLSRFADDGGRITATGAVIGTPAYMSPEQIRGDREGDHRMDIYSLGVIAYEMLTGSLPHEGETSVALLVNRLHKPAEAIALKNSAVSVPKALETLVMRCLEQDPSARPQSAAAIEADLHAVLRETTTPAGSTDLIGTMVGSFRVTQLLGAGGTGAVYEAEHPVIGTKVAIKVLLPEVASSERALEYFIQEAKTASMVGGTALPKYFDFGHLADGRAYAIMEYLQGETVARRLERMGPLPLGIVKKIGIAVARALDDAHRAGVIHRDLKPENLFLATDGSRGSVVKILDFGIAKLLGNADSAKRTQLGLFVGTPNYAAPEQGEGKLPTTAVDVYALGVTLFELLSGRLPFEGNVDTVLGAKLHDDAPSIRVFRPTLPDSVERTVAKMLERDPQKRLRSMGDVLNHVESWGEDDLPATHMETGPTVEFMKNELRLPMERAPRKSWLVTGVVAVVLIAVGVTWFTMFPSKSDVTEAQAKPNPAVPVAAAPAVVHQAPAPTAVEAPQDPIGEAVPAAMPAPTPVAAKAKPEASSTTSPSSAQTSSRRSSRAHRTTDETSSTPSTRHESATGSRNGTVIADPFE